ncbi:hypothetical protein [Nostoc edaphicum]
MSTKHIAEYFNFLSSEDIRLKDSRIGIEIVDVLQKKLPNFIKQYL